MAVRNNKLLFTRTIIDLEYRLNQKTVSTRVKKYYPNGDYGGRGPAFVYFIHCKTHASSPFHHNKRNIRAKLYCDTCLYLP